MHIGINGVLAACPILISTTLNPFHVLLSALKDRAPFGAIYSAYGLSEAEVIALMRRGLKPASFKSWSEQVGELKIKHNALKDKGVTHSHCPTQYKPR